MACIEVRMDFDEKLYYGEEEGDEEIGALDDKSDGCYSTFRKLTCRSLHVPRYIHMKLKATKEEVK